MKKSLFAILIFATVLFIIVISIAEEKNALIGPWRVRYSFNFHGTTPIPTDYDNDDLRCMLLLYNDGSALYGLTWKKGATEISTIDLTWEMDGTRLILRNTNGTLYREGCYDGNQITIQDNKKEYAFFPMQPGEYKTYYIPSNFRDPLDSSMKTESPRAAENAATAELSDQKNAVVFAIGGPLHAEVPGNLWMETYAGEWLLSVPEAEARLLLSQNGDLAVSIKNVLYKGYTWHSYNGNELLFSIGDEEFKASWVDNKLMLNLNGAKLPLTKK